MGGKYGVHRIDFRRESGTLGTGWYSITSLPHVSLLESQAPPSLAFFLVVRPARFAVSAPCPFYPAGRGPTPTPSLAPIPICPMRVSPRAPARNPGPCPDEISRSLEMTLAFETASLHVRAWYYRYYNGGGRFGNMPGQWKNAAWEEAGPMEVGDSGRY